MRTVLSVLLLLAAFPLRAAVTGTIMNSDGSPIAGARVSLFAYESPGERSLRLLSSSPEATPLVTTQTSSKGAFTLDAAKEAVVSLHVSAEGFLPMQTAVERNDDVGALVLSRATMGGGSVTAGGKPLAAAVVVLSYGAAEHLTRTDEKGRFAAPDPKRARSIVVVHPGFAIHDRFLGDDARSDLPIAMRNGVDLRGRVLGRDGKPVAGAAIEVDGWTLGESGEDGSFAIARAPEKWKTITARKDTLIAQRVYSRDAEQTLRLEPGTVLSGRVTDTKTSLPVPGVTVSVVPSPMRGMVRATAAVRTDAKGFYSLTVPAGSWALTPSHPGYSWANAGVTAAVGANVSRDFAIQPVARVSGTVIDEDRKAVAAAAITVDESEPMRLGPMMRFRRGDERFFSGPDGRFSIRLDGDRAVVLRASRKGVPPAKSDSLRLAPGERKSSVVLTMPTGYAVTGRVTDGDGNPLSGVSVVATEAEDDGGRMVVRRMIGGGESRQEDPVTTGADGAFTMRVKEGEYDFGFTLDGYAPRTVRNHAVSPTSSPAIETTLDPAVEIAGRVVRGGAGVADVELLVFGRSEKVVTTGPDGSFVIGGLAAGPVQVMLRKDEEFIQAMRNFSAPARDVVVELPAGGRISGRVVEKGSGKPLQAFRAGISTSMSGGGMVRMSPPQLRDFTSEDGSFLLENVPAGSTVLVANAPGYAGGRLNVTVEEGKTLSDLVLELDTGIRVFGKVTGSNGAPLSNASISVMPSATGAFATGNMRMAATTDANGEYSLEGMSAGEETLAFSHDKHSPLRKTVTLKGPELRVDAQLSAGLRVTGTVVSESGAPVAEAEVTAFGAGGLMDRTRTNAGGAFEFDGLLSGRYRFSARRSGFAEGVVEDLDIAAGSPVRIVMKTGGSIYGRVTGLTAAELSNTMVEARSGRSSTTAAVDASANYRLEGVPAGTVTVSASTMSGAFTNRKTSASETVEVTAGSSSQLDLVFRGDAVIEGRVIRNGSPLRGGNISFVPRSRMGARASTTIDDEGRYSISGLENGDYSVYVLDLERFSPYETTHSVSGAATFDISFNTSSLRGRVVDAATSEPIADANVQIRSAEAAGPMNISRGSVTDSSGTFVLDSIAPGSYTLTISRDGYGNEVRDLQLGSSSIDDLQVKLASNSGVSLRVVDARDGRPLSGMVAVFDAQGRVVHESRFIFGAGTDASDSRLPIAPGEYTAWVFGLGYAGRNIRLQSPSAVTVPLSPGGTIELHSSTPGRYRLIDENGLAYPRMPMGPQARDLLAGTTPIQSVAAGTYTIQLLGNNDVVLRSEQVTVQEGRVARVDL